eukprot:219506_1
MTANSEAASQLFSSILLTLSLFSTFVNCQYFLLANNTYCLATGINSITNYSQLFWLNASLSSNCVNFRLDTYNHEIDTIYNGKFYVNGIGESAIYHSLYQNYTMIADDTSFIFSQAQSRLPQKQTCIAVGYDSIHENIELVGGFPSGQDQLTGHIQYDISTDTFYDLGHPFAYYQRSYGQSYAQIGDVLYTGNWRKYNVVSGEYTNILLPSDQRFGCTAAIDDRYIFFAGDNMKTVVYDTRVDSSFYGPLLQEIHTWGTCQIVNHFLYVIGGRNSSSVEKLYVGYHDIKDINRYIFEYLTDSLNAVRASIRSIRSEVIGYNIFIQTSNSPNIEVLDTTTDKISVIGKIKHSYSSSGSILVENIWYLFGGSAYPGTNFWNYYDFESDMDLNINSVVAANGMNEFELRLTENVLINKKFGSEHINCKLGIHSTSTIFMLDGNRNFSGYGARFYCSNIGIVNYVSINIKHIPQKAKNSEVNTKTTSIFATNISVIPFITTESSELYEDVTNSFSMLEIILIAGGSMLCICVIVLFIRISKNEKISKSLSSKKYVMKNAMVLLIGIGSYDDDVDSTDEQLENSYLANLDVDLDIKNLYRLFGDNYLNYTIYPNYNLEEQAVKINWTQAEVINFLTEKASLLENNLPFFDGLIVVISCHGLNDHICTSDYRMIHKTAIHRIFSVNHTSSREIPRIFIYDCCNGTYQYGKGISVKEIHKSTAEKSETDDQPKSYTTAHIQQRFSRIWDYNTRNPDHKLVEIHSSNTDFQAKMNNDIGSYMLYEFVTKVIDDLDNNKNQYIHQIFDDIQNELENRGKQLTTNTYNNNTGYIKFKPNKNKDDDENELLTHAASNDLYTHIALSPEPDGEKIEMEEVTTPKSPLL